MKTITNNFEGFLLSTFNYKEKTYLIYYVNSNTQKFVKVYNNKTLINSFVFDLKANETDIQIKITERMVEINKTKIITIENKKYIKSYAKENPNTFILISDLLIPILKEI